jgi:hypothetical protein
VAKSTSGASGGVSHVHRLRLGDPRKFARIDKPIYHTVRKNLEMFRKKTAFLAIAIVLWLFGFALLLHPMTFAGWVVSVAAFVAEVAVLGDLVRDMWRANRLMSREAG